MQIKIFTLVSIILFFCSSAWGQEVLNPCEESRIAEIMGDTFHYPTANILGGLEAFYALLTYPESAIMDSLEGTVRVVGIVEADSSLSCFSIVSSAGSILDKIVIDALHQSRFIPATSVTDEDVLLPSILSFPITFQLQSEQDESKERNNHMWVNLGYGFVGGNNIYGVGFIANAQYFSKIGLIGFRYFKADNTAIHTGFSNYMDDISEIGITYGYSRNFGILNLSASAGVGALWGEERGPGVDNNFAVVTIPVQGSFILQPAPIIGLGVMLSTSVNSHSTITGAHFVLQLGRLRL